MIYSDLATWVGPTGNETPHGMGNAYGVVLHIQEGTEAGTEAWQRNPASQVSSHFLAPKSGRLRQMVDTADRAWCEVAGNSHWWSIEIEGHHGDHLTGDQLEACAQVLARAHRDEAVPLAISNNPNATTDAQGGLGYHAMGGNAWGGHFDCPGQPIIDAPPAIVARAQQIIGGFTMPTVPGTGERDDLTVLSDLWHGEQNISSGFGPGQTLRQAQRNPIGGNTATGKARALTAEDPTAIAQEGPASVLPPR